MTSRGDNKDAGWEHGTLVGMSGSQCNYCGKVMKTGGVTRLKNHLIGGQGDVARCPSCPENVRKVLLKLKKESKKKLAINRVIKKTQELGHLGPDSDVEINALDDNEPSEARALQTLLEWPAEYGDTDMIVSQEQKRLEEMLKSKGMLDGSYPPFGLSIKRQQVIVKFQVPQRCHVSSMIADLVARLGLKAEEHENGSRMIIRSWDSAVARQLLLSHPEMQGIHENSRLEEAKNKHEGALCILMFESLITSEDTEIKFIKQGRFSIEELEAVASALKIASTRGESKRSMMKITANSDRRDYSPSISKYPPVENSIAALETMGVKVFGLDEANCVPVHEGVVSWGNIAAYDEQKREIEDTVVLALRGPEVYDNIAHGTRSVFESNRPRAILLEGPPGTGKTSCARVIANQAGIPLLYVPLDIVVSNYHRESARLLSQVFSFANELPNGALIFLDEVDSLSTSCDSEMDEASASLLFMLLRQFDSFEQDKRPVVIAATNRKDDLDPALMSRFDSIIAFGLPDENAREKIAAQYAKQLTKSELVQLATATDEMSGRDIRDVCQRAERRWASKIIRGQACFNTELGHLPPIGEYLECAEQRRRALLEIINRRAMKQGFDSLSKKHGADTGLELPVTRMYGRRRRVDNLWLD